MTTAKFIQFFDERPEQFDNITALLLFGRSRYHQQPIDEQAIITIVERATPFSRNAQLHLDYWRARVELEWLVVNVTEDGIAHLCNQLHLPQPTLQSRTPYKAMFTLIRDQLRERFPFPETISRAA